MSAPTIALKDLPADVRKKLGRQAPRRAGMSLHQVRTNAFRVMAVLAELSTTERSRVLRQCAKLNDV